MIRKSGKTEMTFTLLVLLLKLLVLFSLCLKTGECVILETKQGKVLGHVEISRGGRQFYAFYGIPYAKPPVGELRFEVS